MFQYIIMVRRFVLLFTGFLLVSCHLEVLDPIRNGLVADFEVGYENQGQFAPLDVSFFNNSTEAVAFRWDFGDGSPISTEFNPIYNYSKPGDYIVKLTATNADGESDEFTFPITINARGFNKRGESIGFTAQTGNAGCLNDSTYFFLINGQNFLYDLDGNLTSTTTPRTHLEGVGYYSDPFFWFGINDPTYISSVGGDLQISYFSAGDLLTGQIFPDTGKPLVHYKDEESGVIWVATGSNSGSDRTTILKVDDREPEVTTVTFEEPYRISSILPLSNGNVALTCSTLGEVGNEETTIRIIVVRPDGVIENSFAIAENETIASASLIREEINSLVVAYSDGLLSIRRYSIDGTLEDSKEIIGAFYGTWSITTRSGDVFILGGDLDQDTNTMFFLKLDANYDQVWKTDLEQFQVFPKVTSITEAKDCGFIIAGNINGGETEFFPFLIKLRPDGTYE